MNRFVKCTLVMMVCYVSSMGSVRADDSSLAQRLKQIDMQRGKTDTQKLEQQCLDLLDEYTSPKNQGRIYAEIAFLYAHAEDADKTVEYCKKALERPLDILTKVAMYETWSSTVHVFCAHLVRRGQSPWGEHPDVRREVAALRLRGIKVILNQGTPVETQPLPLVHKVNCHPPDSPSCQKSHKENEERRRARARVMLENDLIFHRKILIGQCVDLYSDEPVDTEELAALARDILGDENVVADLVARVTSRITGNPKTNVIEGE